MIKEINLLSIAYVTSSVRRFLLSAQVAKGCERGSSTGMQGYGVKAQIKQKILTSSLIPTELFGYS